ncbi:PAS domain S-box protein [Paraburkholderia adhaesiva]|uniref:PAS domain S-box protein n=1 Tax=Paraburkholderia adhaesiva TaxID=2883244 RepID=UPI001F3F9094|nr:PAS domain S-box protein [Paraburkholderia adhaesiva]
MLLAWALWRSVRRPTVDSAALMRMVCAGRLNRDAICVVDTAGRIIATNQSYDELTGYTPAELQDRPFCRMLHDRLDDPATLTVVETALCNRSELRTDISFRATSGEVHTMILELHPLHDVRGRFLGHGVAQIDIDLQRREREKTERLLRHHQAVLDILDQFAIVSETDLDGRITYVNTEFVKLSGYDQTELLGRPHGVISSGYHDAQFWHEMWDTITQGKIWNNTVCNRAKNGSLYWEHVAISPLLGADGLPEKYLSIHLNITSLKLNRDLLERTGRIARIGGWYAELGTQRVNFSREALTILGVQLPVQSDIDDEHALPEAWRELYTCIREATTARKAFIRTLQIALPDGRTHAFRVAGEIEYLDDRPYRLVGAAQDITELLETRQRALASERTLYSAIEALDEAFALFDEQEKLVFCNEKYRAIAGEMGHRIVPGLAFEEVLRIGVEANAFLDAENDPQKWLADQLQAMHSPHSSVHQHLRDGRWLDVISAVTEDGMRIRICLDVTEMHRALEAAHMGMRSKSQFLANMSHEIRTPMNAIIGMLQLIRHTALDSEQQDLLDKTNNAAHTLLSLLNDILDFSKIDANQMQLSVEPFELDALLAELSVILSGSLGERNLELIYDIDPDIPPVLRGDALRLKQVLMNLGSNAIKFTHSGEVVVRVRMLQLDETGALLEFAVEDTGIGISAEQRPRIFNAFSQAETSTSRRYGGTGLGLTISKRLIQLMLDHAGTGCDLDFDSKPGQGSRFFFQILLPVAPNGAAFSQPPKVEAGTTAWLLEPHPHSSKALERMLAGMGWQVQIFSDANSMQATVRAGAFKPKPKLVLLNQDAPQRQAFLDGLATLQDDPPVLLTMSSRSLNVPRATLCKPVTAGMVRVALGRHSTPELPRVEPPPVVQRLANLHLLLVEDNAINQEVALRMLAREGATVSVVGDGQAALDALDATPHVYDLVLMDLHMPTLDGLQATRAIRCKPQHAGLPIIAMTANAMEADRQACLEAGMSDHIGKPFDLNRLIEIILQHTRGAQVPFATEIAALPPEAPVTPLLDAHAALNRLNHDTAFYARLLHDFILLAPALGEKVLETQSADSTPIREAAHQLKSTAALVGASRLASVCESVEQALRRDPESVPNSEARLSFEKTLNATLEAQHDWLARHTEVSAGKTISDDTATNGIDIEASLDRLVAHLAVHDMDALDLFDELVLQCGATLSGPSWAALQQAMNRFDTEAAIDAIRELQKLKMADSSFSEVLQAKQEGSGS